MNSKKEIWVIVTLLLCSSLTVMAGATIAPALSELADHFKYVENGAFLARLVLTIPGLFIALGAPIFGIIIDRYKRLSILKFGMIFYSIFGTAGFYLTDIYILLLSRAGLGIAVGAIMTTTVTLIGDYFEGEKRNYVMSRQGAFMAVGGIVFIVLGGLLADIHWNYPFLVYTLSIFIFIPVLVFLKEPIRTNINQEKPNIMKVLQSNKQILFVYGLILVHSSLFYLVPMQVPFLVKEMDPNINNLFIGLAISSSTLMGAIASFLYPKLKLRLSFNQIYSLIFLLMAIGYILIAIIDSYFQLIFCLMLSGSAMGMMMPNSSLCLLNESPQEVRGSVLGGFTTFIFTGQFVSPFIAQPLSDLFGIKGMFVCAGVFILFFGVYFMRSFIYKN